MIALLLVAESPDGPRVLIQRRRRPTSDTTHGSWEVPQGKVGEFSSLFDTAVKELADEAGMELQSFLLGEGEFAPNGPDVRTSLRPFWCAQTPGENGQLAIFVCAAGRGVARASKEADSHRWVTREELAVVLEDENVMPLDRDALERWLLVGGGPGSLVAPRHGRRRVVAFDLGGVLVRSNDSALFDALDICFGFPAGSAATFLGAMKWRHDLHAGRLSPSELWRRLADRGKRIVPFSDFRAAWCGVNAMHDHNLALLSRLRVEFPEVQLAIASNIDAMTERWVKRQLAWERYIDRWVASFRIGTSKPDSRFFACLAETCETSPENVLLVDDQERNTTAAEECGLATLRVAPDEQISAERLREKISRWLRRGLANDGPCSTGVFTQTR